jgi:hypothetical protein
MLSIAQKTMENQLRQLTEITTIGDIDVLSEDSNNKLVNLINSKTAQTQIKASKDERNRLQLYSLDGRGINATASNGLLGLHLPGKVAQKIMPYYINSAHYLPYSSSNLDSSLYSKKILHTGFTINGIVINDTDTTISSRDDLVDLINTKSDQTFVIASNSSGKLKLTVVNNDPEYQNLNISYTNKDDVYVLGLDRDYSNGYYSSRRSQEIQSGVKYNATDNESINYGRNNKNDKKYHRQY